MHDIVHNNNNLFLAKFPGKTYLRVHPQWQQGRVADYSLVIIIIYSINASRSIEIKQGEQCEKGRSTLARRISVGEGEETEQQSTYTTHLAGVSRRRHRARRSQHHLILALRPWPPPGGPLEVSRSIPVWNPTRYHYDS